MNIENYNEMISILKELIRVGRFYYSAIEIDVYETGDGDEIGKRISDVLEKIDKEK